MKKRLRFIIVDDDPIHNTLCRFFITAEKEEVEVLDFIRPEEGLQYILSLYEKFFDKTPSILFININMPGINGWELLEKISSLDTAVKKHLTIFMVSASVDLHDRKRARENKHLKDYLIKPVTPKRIQEIIADFNAINSF